MHNVNDTKHSQQVNRCESKLEQRIYTMKNRKDRKSNQLVYRVETMVLYNSRQLQNLFPDCPTLAK